MHLRFTLDRFHQAGQSHVLTPAASQFGHFQFPRVIVFFLLSPFLPLQLRSWAVILAFDSVLIFGAHFFRSAFNLLVDEGVGRLGLFEFRGGGVHVVERVVIEVSEAGVMGVQLKYRGKAVMFMELLLCGTFC